MRWEPESGGLIVRSWTPDKVAERNEELAWRMRHRVPWHLLNGHMLGNSERGRHTRESIAEDLRTAMQIGRSTWKGGMRELALAGEMVAAEGTYGALGAYPLEGELASFTPTAATEGALLTSAANSALYMPVPQRGLLAPQAYRFVLAGRVTTSVTAGNVSFPIRLGNANTSPRLDNMNPQAKVVSITNAIFIVKGDITVTQVGPPGVNSKAFGHFQAFLNNTTTPGGTAISWVCGSTAAASFDSTVAPNSSANGGQVWVGLLESAGASPWSVGAVHYMDWN